MSAKRMIQMCLILVLLLSSMAATRNAQALSACGGSYVVQRGDWLAKIARNCGTTLADLYAANPWLRWDRYIYAGQVITIPGGYDDGGYYDPTPYYCGPSWDAYGSYWMVCRGDTLGGIARYYGVTWKYLQWNNSISNANVIYPGQVIRP